MRHWTASISLMANLFVVPQPTVVLDHMESARCIFDALRCVRLRISFMLHCPVQCPVRPSGVLSIHLKSMSALDRAQHSA